MRVTPRPLLKAAAGQRRCTAGAACDKLCPAAWRRHRSRSRCHVQVLACSAECACVHLHRPLVDVSGVHAAASDGILSVRSTATACGR
jgi:hypothetical protein